MQLGLAFWLGTITEYPRVHMPSPFAECQIAVTLEMSRVKHHESQACRTIDEARDYVLDVWRDGGKSYQVIENVALAYFVLHNV